MRGDVVDGDDVRVAELGDDAAFAQETRGEFLIRGQHGLDDFQRHVTMQRLLRGKVDDRHAALAEFALDLIAWNMHVWSCFIAGAAVRRRVSSVFRAGRRGQGNWCVVAMRGRREHGHGPTRYDMPFNCR